MINRLLLLLLLSLPFSLPVLAQTSHQHGTGAPSAATCASARMYGRVYDDTSVDPPVEFTCGSGGWKVTFNVPTSGGTTPGYPANQPVSGCGVEYVSGLIFTVGPCVYTIGGTQFSITTNTTVTLAAADATNPRIDVIYVDNTGVASKITGTPAASPAQPTVDYSTQLPLNLVLVAANATTPSNIAITELYEENTEWTCAVSSNIACASTSNPFRGTKDIEATTAVLGNNFTLVKPAAGTTDLSTQNTLIFYIRSKATWPSANNTGANGLRTLSLFWLNGSTQVGVQVVLKDGSFGFNSSNTSAYQQIAIPVSNFGTGANLVTTLKAQVTGNGGTSSFGWYIDAVTLQSGQAPLTLPATLMNFKGTYSSTANYNTNDVVVSSGVYYTALAASTNVAVTTAATWVSGHPAATTCTAPAFLNAISALGVGTCITPVITLSAGCASASYTTVLGDGGKMLVHLASDNNARTCTIDSNANVAYPVGTCLTFINLINTMTIAITSDTMTLMGANTTGSRTLAVGNWATACKIASTSWVIGGSSGLT